MKKLTVILIAVIAAGSIYNSFQISGLNKKINSLNPADEQKFEVGDVMTKLQRHSNKLWFSGKNGNWKLAHFYIEELKETFEELSEKEIVEDGAPISLLAGQMGLMPLKALSEVIDQKNSARFKTSYQNLIDNCNSCHQASNYGYVIIKTPTIPLFDNQEY